MGSGGGGGDLGSGHGRVKGILDPNHPHEKIHPMFNRNTVDPMPLGSLKLKWTVRGQLSKRAQLPFVGN